MLVIGSVMGVRKWAAFCVIMGILSSPVGLRTGRAAA
jgi:hypothetical protein